MVKSTDGSVAGTSLEKYYVELLKFFDEAGYVANPGPQLEGWFKDAGFVNIKVVKYLIPLGTWPKNTHYVSTV